MILRIVKMEFDPAKVTEFKQLFEQNRKAISSFDGCHEVKLMNHVDNPAVFFTISHWESEQHLNAYRESILFNQVWSQTKKLFNAKPEAWTLLEVN